MGAACTDGGTHGAAFVATEVVHDNDVAGLQRGHEDLRHVGKKTLTVDRPVEHARSRDAVMAQTCEKRQRLPVTMWNLRDQPLAAGRTPMRTGHVGFGPGFVDEDQTLGIELSLMPPPSQPPAGNVGPILLAGVQAFF